jgi:hypothetical protein
MTAGFQAFSDTGVVQIDGTTPNYQLIASLVQVTQLESIPAVYNNVGTQFYATLWHTTFIYFQRQAAILRVSRRWRCDGDAVEILGERQHVHG